MTPRGKRHPAAAAAAAAAAPSKRAKGLTCLCDAFRVFLGKKKKKTKMMKKSPLAKKKITYFITISRATCEDEQGCDGPRTVQTKTFRLDDVPVRRRGHELRMDDRWIGEALFIQGGCVRKMG
ncbi:hypothetical protein QTP88_027738 [Uroleucon formosanum]